MRIFLFAWTETEQRGFKNELKEILSQNQYFLCFENVISSISNLWLVGRKNVRIKNSTVNVLKVVAVACKNDIHHLDLFNATQLLQYQVSTIIEVVCTVLGIYIHLYNIYV